MAISSPFNAALSAYGNAAKLVERAGPAGGSSAPVAGATPDFGKMLADTLSGVVENGRATDAKAMDLVSGQGNVVDVVTAIAETEIAIESMVTVRDRVISAYEEIMRMPI
ncbi:flagellar hook-basal body complex protein FliE [Devosia enhydra]|uniref:Flagellar hook-basal body complex protein FliE n=1 Tax=Devosia enhydra TaxID=665118 RepID=A0A1K2HTG5_9HYPH|nr:flagellar hook-basal body complex protein FliE [Devosia enhydra]